MRVQAECDRHHETADCRAMAQPFPPAPLLTHRGSDPRSLMIEGEIVMKALRVVRLSGCCAPAGGVFLSVALSSAVTPAFALGGCGPNFHRSSVTGQCIWGGQNQAWCVRHKGRAAVPGPR